MQDIDYKLFSAIHLKEQHKYVQNLGILIQDTHWQVSARDFEIMEFCYDGFFVG